MNDSLDPLHPSSRRLPAKPLSPGTLIDGRIEVIKPLSLGDYCQVYLAREPSAGGRIIAIKILSLINKDTDGLIKARFYNEIRASHRVQHPNVVRTFEYISNDSIVAYTMEYFPGGDLASLVDAHGQLPISRALDIFVQLSDGLQAIHAAGIIHRDIKPENILIADDGVVKISDFGIARMGTTLGKGRGIVGTLTYLSPEYLRDGRLDQRSDIYSAGIVAYELITGRVPVSGSSVVEILQLQIKGNHRPVHELNPFCPIPLSRIISRALQVDPDQRYQSGAEMLDDLLQTCKAVGVAPSSSTLPKVYDEEEYGLGSSSSNPVVNSRVANSADETEEPQPVARVWLYAIAVAFAVTAIVLLGVIAPELL